MSSGSLTRLARAPVLIGAGAFLVHRLRFELAPVPQHVHHSHKHGVEAGHAYLGPLGQWLIVGLLLVGVGFGLALQRAWRDGSSEPPPRSFWWLWPRCTVVLQAIFFGQELLEGWLSAERAGGLDGVLGSGGWIALPLAVLVGAVVALLLQQAAELVRATARRRRAPAGVPRLRPVTPRAADELRRRDLVADFLVGRGPPIGGLPAA